MADLKKLLAEYAATNGVKGKGPLSVVLTLNRDAMDMSFPLDPDSLVTDKGGQVKGLGKAAVQKILKDHGIDRVLSEEGGRTSRGSMQNMRSYVAFLNDLHAKKQLDLKAIEKWWIERVKEFFSAKPFKFRVDHSKSMRSAVHDLIEQAFKRQKELPGTMFAGAVFQHLVGAKLELLLPGKVKHSGFSVADAPSARQGDFLVDDVCIHVTTAPGEALVRKCKGNLEAGHRPLVVTTAEGVAGIEALARNANIEGRIDAFEIEQFVASNIYELSRFAPANRKITVEALVDRYNAIIDECETDPSLKIEVG